VEEVDRHNFLFGIEVGADRQHLAIGVAGVEQDLLSGFCRLEAFGVALWFWGLSGNSLESRGEFNRTLDLLPILDALDIALIGVLKEGADGTDSIVPRHRQREVCVVGDGHELGIAD